MSDLTELYQEVILDHNRRPRNFRRLEDASHKAEGYNPLCGDRLNLFLRLDGERIADVGFQGSGCAISKASASLMTDSLRGLTVAEARARSGSVVVLDPRTGEVLAMANQPSYNPNDRSQYSPENYRNRAVTDIF